MNRQIGRPRFVWTVEVECLDCPDIIRRTGTSDVSQKDAKRKAENLAWTEFDNHVARHHASSNLLQAGRFGREI
jgi:hypothetical protein